MSSIIRVDTLQKPDGSTPTAADLGLDVAGTIVQTSHHKWADVTQITSTSWTDCIGSSFTFTPKYSTSKLLIVIDGAFEHQGQRGMSFRIVHDGIGVYDPLATHELYDVTSTDQYVRASKHEMTDAVSTSPRTIKLQIASYTGTTVRCNTSSSFYSSFTVYEIAQ